ncbi:MAG: hypothetical protein D6718_03060 [Acidobacteria bacterium]|nr:MAG: hypothetical protein D6718_03060 [Acidobacteriota bacterium]
MRWGIRARLARRDEPPEDSGRGSRAEASRALPPENLASPILAYGRAGRIVPLPSAERPRFDMWA